MGGEAYDFNSMLGPKDTDSDVDMYWMQYLRNATGGAWQVAHPNVRGTCELSLASSTCTGAWPAHFKGSVSNVNFTDGDAMRIWTTAH